MCVCKRRKGSPDGTQVFHSELIQGDISGFSCEHGFTGHAMGLSERHLRKKKSSSLLFRAVPPVKSFSSCCLINESIKKELFICHKPENIDQYDSNIFTMCLWHEIYRGRTHPLPHKVVGQVGCQHVGTERRLHRTVVDLQRQRTHFSGWNGSLSISLVLTVKISVLISAIFPQFLVRRLHDL